jgi:hypothetical protein
MRPLHEQLARPLIGAGAAVVCAGLAVELLVARAPGPATETLVGLFSLSYEANLPTWYASSLLLGCALLLSAIAREAGSRRGHWIGLAAGFGFMSLDEAIEIHEHLGGRFGGAGLLHFDWVIPATGLVAVLGVLYLPFLGDLPPRRRRQFVIAGAIYVGGAVGADLPLGWWTSHAGPDNLGYAVIDWAGESLEVLGATIFLLALAERWHEREGAVP